LDVVGLGEGLTWRAFARFVHEKKACILTQVMKDDMGKLTFRQPRLAWAVEVAVTRSTTEIVDASAG
jgi:hypothetical protein